MKTKTLLSLAAALALPITVNAQNISGAMYTAPSAADTNHPAPTTGNSAPYGRIDIDTADQEHIATTAYVKGAYNSAIAAVNKVDSEKQGKLGAFSSGDDISSEVIDMTIFNTIMSDAAFDGIYTMPDNDLALVTADAVADGIMTYVDGYMTVHPITIYTTWDDDSASATTTVTLN